jgi:hypothetical protein
VLGGIHIHGCLFRVSCIRNKQQEGPERATSDKPEASQ